MKLGILANISHHGGGVYQYTVSLIELLYRTDRNYDFIIFCWPGNRDKFQKFTGEKWKISELDPQILNRSENIQPYLSGDGLDLNQSGINSKAQFFFASHNIDFLIFPVPTVLSFECGIPYIMAIQDLQHRIQPEFPEVSAGGIWHSREYMFRNAVKYAEAILVDSEVGKEDVLNFYGNYIQPERVYPLPLWPAYKAEQDITDARKAVVRQKYNLPDRYFFYPAQFWMHKNHSRLIHAIHKLRFVYHTDTPLILVGSHSGGEAEGRELIFQNAMFLSEHLNVQDLVRYLGYVPDEDMPVLYSMATALAMPTHFGPTNTPVSEAWSLNCPVLTSDIRGIREHVGGAGILVDPRNTDALAEALLKLWTDQTLRISLVEKGRNQLAAYTPDGFTNRLYAMLDDVRDMIKNPINQDVVSDIRQSRNKLASQWLTCPGDQLEKAYTGDMGNLHRKLMESNLRNEKLTHEENAFLQHVIAELTKRSATDPVSAINYLLSAMLYLPSDRLKIENARASLPGWLFGDYEKFFCGG